MTPKQKAEELHRKFWTGRDPIADNLRITTSWSSATQCALIAVNEMINLDYDSLEYYGNLNSKEYWQEVKQEIEML